MSGPSLEVIGIVVNREGLVWTKDAYPGTYGTLENSDGVSHNDIQVGSWVSMQFSQAEMNIYFPENKTIDTPEFRTASFSIINPKHLTECVENGENVEITISKIEIDEDHKLGDALSHPDFDTVGDVNRLIKDGPGTYTIIISRCNVKVLPSRKLTVWQVINAHKIVQNERVSRRDVEPNRDSSPTRPRAKSALRRTQEPTRRRSRSIRWKDSDRDRLVEERVYVPDPREHEDHEDPPQPPFVRQVPVPPKERKNPRLNDNNGNGEERIIRIQQNEKKEKKRSKSRRRSESSSSKEIFLKHAMITKIGENQTCKKGATYFLWLTEDHKDSIYHTLDTPPHLKVGYFFEGQFVKGKNAGTFKCIGENKEIDFRGIETKEVDDGFIEIHLEVFQYDPTTLIAYHRYFGDILNSKELPFDNFENGVRIAITRFKIGWVTLRILTPAERLVEEFRKFWDKDYGRLAAIARRLDTENKLADFFDN